MEKNNSHGTIKEPISVIEIMNEQPNPSKNFSYILPTKLSECGLILIHSFQQYNS